MLCCRSCRVTWKKKQTEVQSENERCLRVKRAFSSLLLKTHLLFNSTQPASLCFPPTPITSGRQNDINATISRLLPPEMYSIISSHVTVLLAGHHWTILQPAGHLREPGCNRTGCKCLEAYRGLNTRAINCLSTVTRLGSGKFSCVSKACICRGEHIYLGQSRGFIMIPP